MASSLNFASNSISWAEASIGVPNHQVCYIPKEHPANPMNQGALVIVKASRRAPTHPRLVCVYNNKWTEVHWDKETKTYSLGASIPQLDEYNTEGSDIQVLIDEELEKTSKEETTLEAESEEELKDPGSSINQQICLTPIAQSLKASPTSTKSNPLIIETTMTTQTATHSSMAITSSQPAPSSSSNNGTTPQQLCDQLQQILRRHGGGPNGPTGPGGPGGPNQLNPALPQQPIQPAADVKTMGALPQIFLGDRTKADDFIDEVKAYLCLNADVAGYNSPLKKVAFTLTFIKGESTAQWIRDMGDWLDRLIMPRDNIPDLWTQFLREFQDQFQDTQAAQRVRNELRDCKMKGVDYDNYIMRFESLARKVNYTTGNKETYNIFLQGLPEPLLHDTLKPPMPLNYNDVKERVKLLAQGQAVIEGILKKHFSGGTPFQHLNSQPRQPFFQNNWQNNNQQRNHLQNYNSTNAPLSMNNILVPMDLSRGHAPNNWRGQGNGNWRQGRGPPAMGNVSTPGYGSSSGCFNCGKEGHYACNCPQKKFIPHNEKNNRQANLINLQDEGEQDHCYNYEIHDAQEPDSVASVHAQLESMPLKDQMHLAKEMGVSQDFPSA